MVMMSLCLVSGSRTVDMMGPAQRNPMLVYFLVDTCSSIIFQDRSKPFERPGCTDTPDRPRRRKVPILIQRIDEIRRGTLIVVPLLRLLLLLMLLMFKRRNVPGIPFVLFPFSLGIRGAPFPSERGSSG
jgi:hypothetical protein